MSVTAPLAEDDGLTFIWSSMRVRCWVSTNSGYGTLGGIGMILTRCAAVMAVAFMCWPGLAGAQQFPAKPIRMIVPYPARLYA